MGGCTNKAYKSLEGDISESNIISKNASINFYVTISKLKVREIKVSQIKSFEIFIIFQFPNLQLNFPKISSTDNHAVYECNEVKKIYYKIGIYEIESKALKILIYSGGLTYMTEIGLKSMINGPCHQDTCLYINRTKEGRISFDIELLQETELTVSANKIIIDSQDYCSGNFSVSLKYMSENAKESNHSEIIQSPK